MSETPILDLDQPPPVPRRANGLLLIPALYVAIAFHELGHLIAGKSGRNWVFRFDRHRFAGLEKSDSARLWQLIRHPERARVWIDANGICPRDWGDETFQRIMGVDASSALDHLENALAKSGRAAKSLVAYARGSDRGRYRAATVRESVPRHLLLIAMIQKQAEQDRTWCARACKLKKPLSLEGVSAGIAMCEGRYSDAVRHWEGARLDSGVIRFAKEKWAEFEAVSRAAQV